MPLVTVGTSAVNLQASASAPGHIQLKAANTNTGVVFVAARSNVTTGATALTAGLPLIAGEALMLPGYFENDASQVYAIADTAAQGLYYEVITGP